MRSLQRFSLSVAGGLTLLLVPLVAGNLHPWGTRGALSSVPWLVFCTPRWLCLALALGSGLRAGRFDWLARRADARWLVVAGAHLGIGLASLFCLVEMSESSAPVPWWLRALAVLISLVVPAIVLAFLAAPDLAPARRWRVLLAGCVLVGMVTGITVGWRAHLDTLEVQREETARKAALDTRQRTALARLDQLALDAPLEQWLPYTGMWELPAVAARAQEKLRSRPHLTYDLVGCLRRADAPTRALVLDFVREGGLPALEPESIPAAREALGAEAASMRAALDAQPDLDAKAFDPECLEAVFLVARYPGHEAAFVPPLRELRAVFDRLPAAAPKPAGQQELDRWLELYAPSKPR